MMKICIFLFVFGMLFALGEWYFLDRLGRFMLGLLTIYGFRFNLGWNSVVWFYGAL